MSVSKHGLNIGNCWAKIWLHALLSYMLLSQTLWTQNCDQPPAPALFWQMQQGHWYGHKDSTSCSRLVWQVALFNAVSSLDLSSGHRLQG